MEQNKNLLSLRAFSEPITVSGKTYYDAHSRMFSIIRLPVIIRSLFPQFQRKKIQFSLYCSPTKEELIQKIEDSEEIPILLSLNEEV